VIVVLRIRSCILLFLLSTFAAGCQDQPTSRPTTLPTVEMTIGEDDFVLEVADSDRERQKGLMFRESMPQDQGMLFVFEVEEELSFWMRNTLIPLDIVYVNSMGKIVSVKQMKPLDETGVKSDGPAKYAIELNLGTAKRIGIKAGDMLKLPDVSKQTGGSRIGNQ
jgi:uncharacterized protein